MGNKKRLAASSTLPFPSYWSVRDEGTDHRRVVECGKDEPAELTAVQAFMDATLYPDAKYHLKVQRVIRVEDSDMWDEHRRSITYITDTRHPEELFQNDGTHLAKTKSGHLQLIPLTTRCLPEYFTGRMYRDANETYLWHATKRAAAESIIQNDFKVRKQSPQVLGKGVYFAESPTLSDKYAVVGPSGFYCMLLVRVVLGKVDATRHVSRFKGKKLVFTTHTTKMVRKGICDSVVLERPYNNTREYCVANNTQLYPEYLILYSREDPKGANSATPGPGPPG